MFLFIETLALIVKPILPRLRDADPRCVSVDINAYKHFYVFMRTTVDLPDGLFRRAKAVSSLSGLSLKDFITRAVEHELEARQLKLTSQRVSLPIVPSEKPGSVRVTPERIAALLEAEDLHGAS